jgi:hypothetical protein
MRLIDDGRGNHRRGSSSWLPRDEAPKQSVKVLLAFRSEEATAIAFSAVKSLNSVAHFIN